MTNEAAVEWVKKEKMGVVVSMASKYSQFTPYGIDDYVQMAYGAAVEAAAAVRKNPSLKFGAVWMNYFKDEARRCTPYPDELRQEKMDKKKAEALERGEDASRFDKKVKPRWEASVSFPSNMRAEVDMDRFVASKGGRSRKIDIEKAYNKIKDRLSEKEQAVMELSLGLTMEGSLTAIEISKKLGMPRQTVTGIRTKAIEKAAKKDSDLQKTKLVCLNGGGKCSEPDTLPEPYLDFSREKRIASRS